MNRDTQRLLRILAVVIFAIGALLALIDEADAKVLSALLFGGLATFALSFAAA